MNYQRFDIPEQLPTDHFINKYKFMCSIPELQSRSVNHLKVFGTPTTGDKEIDKQLSKQWLTTYLSIKDMLEYYKQGISIRVKSKKDIEVMYDYISKYLQAWKNFLNTSMNLGNAPIDDLIALDQFANEIYEHAKYQFTKDTADSILARQLSAMTRFNRQNFFRNGPDVKQNSATDKDKEKEQQYPDRLSYADIFKERKWN